MPKPANDTGSPALQAALNGVRRFSSQLEAEAGRDKLEIITDLMRGPDGATVEDVVALTGWPVILVE